MPTFFVRSLTPETAIQRQLACHTMPGSMRQHSVPSGISVPGFTVVELLVVIAVISLVLGIAIPGINSMQAQINRSSAVQAMDSALTRAKYSAAASGDYVALRFMPSIWSGPVDPNDDLQQAETSRMQIVTYEWSTASFLEDINQVQFIERFEARAETSIVRMPRNVWVAPLEATFDSSKPGVSSEQGNAAEDIVAGEPGFFTLDAGGADSGSTSDFMQMDDFLIIFDQEGHLVQPNFSRQQLNSIYDDDNLPFPIYAYDPDEGVELDRDPSNTDELYTRFNFSGVTVYQRDSFIRAVGSDGQSDANAEARVQFLADNGDAQLIHPRSGRLKGVPQ